MEAKINIAEILKDKPQGTKLYADAFGELSIVDIYTKDEIGINLLNRHRDELLFYSDGRYCTCGEPILFPSKSMRDWSKFAWKKGDVLVSNDGKREVLFETWENDSYTKFVGLHCLITNDNEEVEYDNGTTVFNTNDFKGTEAEDVAQTYINTIEERLGGKLNLETLEIEKHQTEFKDGDIVTAVFTDGDKMICVFKEKIEQDYMGYCGFFSKGKHEGDVSMDLGDDCIYNDSPICMEIRLATDSEKQQLFDALAKVGKAWDAEKKQIVDLKSKWTPKPFDKVLVRDRKTYHWEVDLFGFKTEGPNIVYHCVGGSWKFCIPYIGNESLLGTTKGAEK